MSRAAPSPCRFSRGLFSRIFIFWAAAVAAGGGGLVSGGARAAEFELILGVEGGLGETTGRIFIEKTRAPMTATGLRLAEDHGGGVGYYMRGNAVFAENWIAGGQITFAYEDWYDEDVLDWSLDILGRVGYNMGHVRPFLIFGASLLGVDGDVDVREDFMPGYKAGVGVDIIYYLPGGGRFRGRKDHVFAVAPSIVVSVGYYYANYPERRIEDTETEIAIEQHLGRLGLGYRF